MEAWKRALLLVCGGGSSWLAAPVLAGDTVAEPPTAASQPLNEPGADKAVQSSPAPASFGDGNAPSIGQSQLEVRIFASRTPEKPVLGKDLFVSLTFTVQDSSGNPVTDAALRFSATVGRIDQVQSLEDGRYIATYTPPPTRKPTVALIAVADAAHSGPGLLFSIPLSARSRFPVQSLPGLPISFEVAGRQFGPFETDENGMAMPEFEVPPGVTRARVVSTRPGTYMEQMLDLSAPPFTCLKVLPLDPLVADGQHSVPVRVLVVQPTGEARLGAPLELSASLGAITEPVDQGDGTYVARYAPPRLHVNQVDIVIARLRNAGPGQEERLKIQLSAAPAQYVAPLKRVPRADEPPLPPPDRPLKPLAPTGATSRNKPSPDAAVTVPAPAEVPVPAPAPAEVPVPAPAPAEVTVPAPAPAEVTVPAPAPAEVPVPAPAPAEKPAPTPTEASSASLESAPAAPSAPLPPPDVPPPQEIQASHQQRLHRAIRMGMVSSRIVKKMVTSLETSLATSEWEDLRESTMREQGNNPVPGSPPEATPSPEEAPVHPAPEALPSAPPASTPASDPPAADPPAGPASAGGTYEPERVSAGHTADQATSPAAEHRAEGKEKRQVEPAGEKSDLPPPPASRDAFDQPPNGSAAGRPIPPPIPSTPDAAIPVLPSLGQEPILREALPSLSGGGRVYPLLAMGYYRFDQEAFDPEAGLLPDGVHLSTPVLLSGGIGADYWVTERLGLSLRYQAAYYRFTATFTEPPTRYGDLKHRLEASARARLPIELEGLALAAGGHVGLSFQDHPAFEWAEDGTVRFVYNALLPMVQVGLDAETAPSPALKIWASYGLGLHVPRAGVAAQQFEMGFQRLVAPQLGVGAMGSFQQRQLTAYAGQEAVGSLADTWLQAQVFAAWLF